METAASVRVCRKCKVPQALTEYCKNSKYKDGIHRLCRSCQSKQAADWYIRNKTRIDARNKKYYEQNIEKVKATNKAYREANKDRLNQKTAEWGKRNRRRRQDQWNYRYHNDPAFRTNNLARNRFREWLRAKGSAKTTHVVDLIGCSYEQLCAHIESLFKPGMTWENRGHRGWHIDHIRPLNSFDPNNPEEMKAAWHYTNLQPLWAKENQSKGPKIISRGIDCRRSPWYPPNRRYLCWLHGIWKRRWAELESTTAISTLASSFW